MYFNIISPIIFFKSVISSDHSRAFIAFYQTNKIAKSFIYYIGLTEFSYHDIESCNTNKLSTMELNYCTEKNKFSFSCISDEGNSILASIIENNTGNVEDINRTLKCSNLNQHSLLYLGTRANYYIIFNLICEKIKLILLKN